MFMRVVCSHGLVEIAEIFDLVGQGSRPDPGPVPVPGRNRRFGGSGSCEPNLNRILNGSWAVPILGGSGPVHPVQVRFFF